MSFSEKCQKLIDYASKKHPGAAAIILAWRLRFFDPGEPIHVTAFTADTHFEAGIISALHGFECRIYPRRSA